jgi:hypothetical protein
MIVCLGAGRAVQLPAQEQFRASRAFGCPLWIAVAALDCFAGWQTGHYAARDGSAKEGEEERSCVTECRRLCFASPPALLRH